MEVCMAGKYYAVLKGRIPGIYFSWEDCKKMVDKFPGAQYKSFQKLEEAEAFMGQKSAEPAEEPENYAFVDGSYNVQDAVYGYGGFLVAGGSKYVLQGSGKDPSMDSMRNVAGEILGSMAAMKQALSLGLTELTIYYDYMGIEMWATGAWKRNKAGTAAYYDYVQSIQDRLKLTFVKVKGHSGIEGNEEADRLAKQAAGIEER